MPGRLGRPVFGQPLLNQQVGVDASETEGADRCPSWGVVGTALPGDGFIQYPERAVVQVHSRLRGAEIGGGGQLSLAHGQQHLGQRGGAGGGQQVADVGLDRTDDAGWPAWPQIAPQLAQAGNLGGVADLRAGGVAFDQVHVPRLPAGPGVGGPHRPQLPFGKRRQQAAAHIVGQADAADYAVDPVAVGNSVFGAFEQKDAGPFSDHQAVSGGVERRADPPARQGAQLGEAHLGIERVGSRESAGQHRVGAAGQQFVGCQFDRVERGGAGGVQGAAAPAQAERGRQHSSRQAGHIAVERVC